MRIARILSVVCATVAIAVPATRVSAQSSTSTPSSAGPSDVWTAKPVGAYTIALDMGDHAMAVDLTISDSTGTLTAVFWPVGDHDGHEMNVDVRGTDLILTADAPRGPVRIVMQRRGDNISGTWSLGEEHGTLTGTPKAKP